MLTYPAQKMVFHNTTFILGVTEVTKGCFDWCKEQHFINQNNIQIQELSIIGIALVSLVLHNIISDYKDYIISNTQVTESQLLFFYNATSRFTYILLTIFLIYFIFFK